MLSNILGSEMKIRRFYAKLHVGRMVRYNPFKKEIKSNTFGLWFVDATTLSSRLKNMWYMYM